jgi:hypothetical protein
MTATKTFHIGDLITVVTGRLVSPNHIGGVYEVCDHVTGEAHMTHQLPRASKTVTPWLIDQHPWLADITVPDFDIPEDAPREAAERIVAEWLSGPAAHYGEHHEVKAMPFGMYVGQEPITELQEMAPHAQIITVEVDEETTR